MALFQSSCQNLALVGWCWGGGGGGGWPCVLCVVSDVLLCILTNYVFRVCLLFFSLLPSPLRWVLSASLLASLASCCFLSVWFALHRRAAVFGPVFWSVFPRRGNVFLQSKKVCWSFALFLDFHFCAFFVCFRFFFGLVCSAPQSCGFRTGFFGPCSHVVGMCSCKARRFVEALRSSWIFTFALFFCLLPIFFGLVCSAPQSCGFRIGFLVRVPTSWECVLAKQEGSLKLCALLGFSLLLFFVCFRLFWSGLLCTHAQLGVHTSGLVQKICDST